MPKKGEIKPRTQLVVLSYKAGLTLRECGKMHGLSWQRCRDIINRWAPGSMRASPVGRKPRKKNSSKGRGAKNGTTKRADATV